MATWAARHENLHTIGYLARRGRWGAVRRYLMMVAANRWEPLGARLWYLRRGRWRPALPGRWHPRDCDCFICYI